jgi:tRNA (cmo5U34)-methyltransferase
MKNKSTVEEIRARFDADVERFSNLESGQSATIDAPLSLELVATVAAELLASTRANPLRPASQTPHIVDVGCGAGNYTLKLLENASDCDCTLIDLSAPMLQRAAERVSASTRGVVKTLQADIREVKLPPASCDVVLAAAVLHHLRGDEEWHAVLANLYAALRPGGSLWIVDLVEHSTRAVQDLMWRRYGEYLTSLKDEAYRDSVFAYIEKEDTPRSLLFHLDALRAAGFADVEVLHKNSVFAAFGAIKK